MTTITTDMLAEIPYLDHASIPGRFLSCLTFYDEDWQFWVVAGEPGDQKLSKMKGWPAEACYFAKEPVEPRDLYLFSVDFVGRIACYSDLQRPVAAIRDDILNLSTSLAKLAHLQGAKEQIPHGLSRMATTEVEYVVLVCRSLFDLFQEVLVKLWNRIKLLDPSIRKKPLKDSFARTILSGDQLLSSEEISTRFGMPMEIASCYGRAADMFLALRRFRDNIVHQGSQLQHIFDGDGCFLIASRFTPFPDMVLWDDSERRPNDLVPLMPAVETLIFRTLAVCDDFCVALARYVQFPPPIVPDMRLFMRGYFTEYLIAALGSGARRSAQTVPREVAADG
ncbi:hypothetical protein [Tistrella mobilis]|uniref:hypothetical protein n=1 Tax=Tistrella mobilis TaxID=171437 RepID=UPI00355623E1